AVPGRRPPGRRARAAHRRVGARDADWAVPGADRARPGRGAGLMGRVALRGIRAHLVRFALSLLAVALGVSFVAGTFSLRTMLSATFSDIVETTMLGDAYVRGLAQG